ncbi:protein distal antenna-related [Drosophila eugracilis]|uniref:protein distal antenna-related n=1 Tax=Drosophila eugracilis TaxID=29029 RepID=UPI0007E8893A|nr:protein distal antenna-related [Drosophila eugracilis]
MDISAYQHMNIRMSTRGKRPLRNLTPNDKVRAIQRIHNGETKASVSRDIGVPESTLRGWCKNEQKLRFMCRQLGPDHMGLDSPPEKRAKFELQLQLPPKFVALPPNYEELGFGSLPYSPGDYPVQGESLLEKLSLVEFVKKNGGLHPEAVHPSQSGVVDYSNNMLHQLNLLALLNSKLTPQTAEVLPVDAPKSEDNKVVDSPAASEDYSKNNYPLLSVKNWAKDPAKRATLSNQPEQVNDKNNNALEANGSGQQVLATEQTKTPMFPDTTIPLLPAPFPNPADLASVIAPLTPANSNSSSTPNGTDNQGAALLDWCKLFNASLNFLAFAAAAASMQPGGGGGPSAPTYNPNQIANGGSEPDLETYPFNEALMKRLSPLAHSEASNESYCDSEPEDLSVRSCASKASSRSHTPDKSIGSSDAEQ